MENSQLLKSNISKTIYSNYIYEKFFFSRFTPQEPKFFPMLKRLSEILTSSSDLLVESMQHDKPEERANYYKRIKDMEREGDKQTHLIFDELGKNFHNPF